MEKRIDSPNGKPAGEETALRDRLAISRTHMANERTFLAYVRTALALALTGAGVMGYFHAKIAFWGGLFMLGTGFLTALTGLLHFIAMKKKIRFFEKDGVSCHDD